VKPMKELFLEVPAEFRVTELVEGNFNRAQYLWEPQKQYLQKYVEILEELARKK
jgi:hypothetical protein